MLNPQQLKAAHHINGPLLVLAGAGSGKTRVVTHRIAHLIETGIDPSQILAVTFTNKAAGEMKARIHALKNASVLASTFHSLGSKILRESIHHLGYQNTFTIYDEEDSTKLLKNCLSELGLDLDKGFIKEAKNFISGAKNDLSSPKGEDLLSRIYQAYQEKLKNCDALDFDDLLFLTVKLFQMHPDVLEVYQNRWLYVLIDEYQDTNLAQYTLTKLLVEKHQNIFAVGDPDQSIYSWRGARYQNILNFEKDFPGATVIPLDQNYRSTNRILQAANALIEHNESRLEKSLWSNLGEGEKIELYKAFNEKKEAAFVAEQIQEDSVYGELPFDEIAIFYRTNAQSRAFEDALLACRIPYTIVGGISFYERKEIKDILAYLRLILSETDLIAFLRIINIPKRGLGKASVEKIATTSSMQNTPILSFCKELLTNPTIKLTPKAKKGLEDFSTTIEALRLRHGKCTLEELIEEILTRTGYLSYLQLDPETVQDRKENIDELLGKAAEWESEQEDPSLAKFLEELSLRVPPKEDHSVKTVKMMTLHNSKGLEFSHVFFVGLEEDLLPHINSKDDPSSIEEERRLCYVGMTRAKKKLYMTGATYRYMWGTQRLMRPSRFLKELPKEFISERLTY